MAVLDRNSRSLSTFISWMDDARITYNRDAIEFITRAQNCSTSGLALGIFARRQINEGEELAIIPKSSCISILNNKDIAPIIQEEGLQGTLGLILSLMHEILLGRQSAWWGYIQSLPQFEHIPQLWSSHNLKHLKGTSISSSRLQHDAKMMKRDYEEHIQPLLDKYPKVFNATFSFELFKKTISLVTSRAFCIDEMHGDSMVPLADAFNHKVALVHLSSGYQVFGGGGGGGEEEGDTSSSDLGNGNSFSVVNPLKRCEYLGLDRANGLDLRLEIGIVDVGDALKIVAASDVEEGKEVHNTYGELSNAELLYKYGFCLRQNPFTTVTIDKKSISRKLEELVKPSTAYKKRFRVVQMETSLLDDDEAMEEPFELLAGGHIGPSLWAALMYLSSGCTKYLNSSNETIGMPRSIGDIKHKVAENILRDALEERMKAYPATSLGHNTERLEKCRDEAEKYALLLRISEKEILQTAIDMLLTKKRKRIL